MQKIAFIEIGYARVETDIFPTNPQGQKSRSLPWENLVDPRRTVEENPEEASGNPSESQVFSESLAEGCAPRIVIFRNFRSFKTSSVLGSSLSKGRQRVGACKRRACRKIALKHSKNSECGNRLRVRVRVEYASVSGLHVDPSKHCAMHGAHSWARLRLGMGGPLHGSPSDFKNAYLLVF